MHLPDTENVEVKFLSKIFDNKSECYKLFWFQAIVNKVVEGKNILTFNELINEMIADSWYMVTQYKLNLGPSDTLEALISYTFETEQIKLKANQKKSDLLQYLESCEDKKLLKMKKTLKEHVPYRLQSSFFKNLRGDEWKVSERKLIEKINKERRLIYYFSELSGLDTKIHIEPEWDAYINKNQDILRGWIQYNLIIYLQRRNPNVLGIANKLYPPQDRKLGKVINYWKMIIEVMPIRDIYGQELLTKEDFSIDHFVPWSYVAHDEFWNLTPTTKSINSSKSNNLPNWNRYFIKLCELEYSSYQIMQDKEEIRSEFAKCKREHVNNNDVLMELYRPGIKREDFYSTLEGILWPVYESARNSGFKEWCR